MIKQLQVAFMFMAALTLAVTSAERGFAQTDTEEKVADTEKKATVEKVDAEDKPATEEKKRKALEGLEGDGGQDPILDLMDEIGQNMKSIEDLLNQPDTGSSTQDLQSQTIDQIEKLIEEVQKRGTT